MIAIDASVIVALAQVEREAAEFEAIMRADGEARLSAASAVEAANVLEGRYGALGRAAFNELIVLLQTDGLQIVAFDAAMAELARAGFRRFGKGRHPARLNLGDCFAYALAKALDAPLLFKGDDFAKTDVKRP